jgi:DNA polymerase
VTQHRGEFLDRQLAEYVMATVRPSSILRAPDEKNRQEEMKRFVSDWKKITRLV